MNTPNQTPTTPIVSLYVQKIDLLIDQLTLISPAELFQSDNILNYDIENLPINKRTNTKSCMDQLIKILENKPGYTEQLVYKLLQLNYINSESDVLLITNSYDVRLTPDVLTNLVKILKA